MTTATQASLSLNSVVSASREQVSSELAGEVVILNLNEGVYHGLDNTGARRFTIEYQRDHFQRIRSLIMDNRQQWLPTASFVLELRLAEYSCTTSSRN